MLRYFTSILAGLALAAYTSCTVAGQPISNAQARTLTPAVAKVLLQRASTTGLLNYCAARFASLKAASNRARQGWLKHNQAILHKADVLHELLWLSLKRQQSGLKAETFSLDIDRLVQQNAAKQKHALASYSPAQQHRLCNHLILAVRAGDWDVARKQAKAVSILENFH